MSNLKKYFIRRLSHLARPYLKTFGLLQTAKFFNKSLIIWEPKGKNIMVLAPHFDDEVIGCGGAIIKHIHAGGEVSVVFITDGRTGSKTDPQLSLKQLEKAETELITERKTEAELALKTLGVKKWFFIDAECSTLTSTKEIQAKLKEIIYTIRPDKIYLPFFLEEHPDHRVTNQILIEAVENEDITFDCIGYEIWTPLFPNMLVKIDDVVDKKKKALEHYKSQLATKNFIHTNLGLNAYRSIAFLDNNVKYAEAFYIASLEDYRSLYKKYKAD